jgi:hypothetical protein
MEKTIGISEMVQGGFYQIEDYRFKFKEYLILPHKGCIELKGCQISFYYAIKKLDAINSDCLIFPLDVKVTEAEPFYITGVPCVQEVVAEKPLSELEYWKNRCELAEKFIANMK